MNIIGVIPARMGSSRFPGKPLAKICGKPMIEHVFKRSAMANKLTDVYIATCDEEISEAAKNFGAKVVMTKSSHERASDRVAEAMLKIEEDLNKRVDILVMVQGDEPMVFPEMIDEAVDPLIVDANIMVTNLMAPIRSRKEQDDRNVINVVFDKNNFALYFSREPIPTRVKTKGDLLMYKQVCIIPFRRDFLLKFNNLQQTPLEIAESVDMMRVLEHGYKVKMVLTKYETYSVDTEEDLNKVEKHISRDKLFIKYR
ncbi:MAG: 3-deoxy-manno-octulosonate cytidylyltransferase [bacterium]|nr:3-deoxy-manno-octulosonate cytidylyltransferase [bacterium]